MNEINDNIVDYKNKNAEPPKFLVLSMVHRQALRIEAWMMGNKYLWDIPDIVAYQNIPIIKKEECVIVGTKEGK